MQSWGVIDTKPTFLQYSSAGVGEAHAMFPGGNDSFTKILLHFDGTNASTIFTDSNFGGQAHTWTPNGSAQLTTATVKFGTAAGLFNTISTNEFISTPDSSDFTVSSGAFTVDFWFNRTSGDGVNRFLFGQRVTTPVNTSIEGLLSGGNVVQAAISSDGVNFTVVTGVTTITASGWHHYAVVRTSDILRLFLDGVQEGGDVAFTGSVFDSSSSFQVGGITGLLANGFVGSIDELRLSVGIARWTSNFTPPAIAYF